MYLNDTWSVRPSVAATVLLKRYEHELYLVFRRRERALIKWMWMSGE